jgi:hypothetical protein
MKSFNQFVGKNSWLVHNSTALPPANTCDLTAADPDLQQIANKYQPQGLKCDYCAYEMTKALIDKGFNAKIIRLVDEFAAKELNAILPGGQQFKIALSGFHEAVKIYANENDVFYMDALVYKYNGPHAVDWNTYQSYFAKDTGLFLKQVPYKPHAYLPDDAPLCAE